MATELIPVDSTPIQMQLPLLAPMSAHVLKHPMSKVLTAREIMVAQMVSQGLPNKKIASQLSISVGTTKTHLHHIYQKLNCAGRLGLAIHMQKNGWF